MRRDDGDGGPDRLVLLPVPVAGVAALALLRLAGDYTIDEMRIGEGDRVSGKDLRPCRLTDGVVTVPGIQREEGRHLGDREHERAVDDQRRHPAGQDCRERTRGYAGP